jgi:uncharacterized membrane-anchored protein YhcB (DUF1043 family)
MTREAAHKIQQETNSAFADVKAMLQHVMQSQEALRHHVLTNSSSSLLLTDSTTPAPSPPRKVSRPSPDDFLPEFPADSATLEASLGGVGEG